MYGVGALIGPTQSCLMPFFFLSLHLMEINKKPCDLYVSWFDLLCVYMNSRLIWFLAYKNFFLIQCLWCTTNFIIIEI